PSQARPSVPFVKGEASERKPVGPSSNGPGGGGRGSGGGGSSGGASPLHQRLGDRDFREVLSKGLASCRRNLITVAIFSFFVNVLVLSIPIYLFNISDRVLTSRSTDTLIMLSIVVAGAVLAHVLMDMMR